MNPSLNSSDRAISNKNLNIAFLGLSLVKSKEECSKYLDEACNFDDQIKVTATLASYGTDGYWFAVDSGLVTIW